MAFSEVNMTDAHFQAVLKDYNARAAREAEILQTATREDLLRDRDQFLLPVGEDVGRVLNSLIVARKATRILEIGTSYGYSTLFLADAARATGGRVMTLEISETKQTYARNELQRARLSGHVEWLRG